MSDHSWNVFTLYSGTSAWVLEWSKYHFYNSDELCIDKHDVFMGASQLKLNCQIDSLQ